MQISQDGMIHVDWNPTRENFDLVFSLTNANPDGEVGWCILEKGVEPESAGACVATEGGDIICNHRQRQMVDAGLLSNPLDRCPLEGLHEYHAYLVTVPGKTN